MVIYLSEHAQTQMYSLVSVIFTVMMVIILMKVLSMFYYKCKPSDQTEEHIGQCLHYHYGSIQGHSGVCY